jgi:hypothetical protein
MNGLVGTMSGQQVQSLDEIKAQQDAVAQQAMLRAAQAQQQAQGAGQEYGQAAAQGPPPMDASIMGALLPALLANVGSVLGGTPAYREQHERRTEMKRGELLKARATNLQALSDKYQNLVKAAQDTGNHAAEVDARVKLDQAHQKFQLLQDKMKEEAEATATAGAQKFTGGQNAAQRRQMERDALIGQGIDPDTGKPLPYVPKSSFSLSAGGSAEAPPELKGLVTTTSTGFQVLNVGNLTGNAKNAAVSWASSNGIPALNSAEMRQLEDVQGARYNVQSILDAITSSLPTDPVERAVKAPFIKMSQVFQTNKQLGSYGAWRTAAIKNLRATAGSGGLRINQKEIELAVKNDIPKVTDTLPVAMAKMQHIAQMLDNAERPLATHDWRVSAKGATNQPTKPTIKMKDPSDGKVYEVDSAEIEEAIKHGWKRSP